MKFTKKNGEKNLKMLKILNTFKFSKTSKISKLLNFQKFQKIHCIPKILDLEMTINITYVHHVLCTIWTTVDSLLKNGLFCCNRVQKWVFLEVGKNTQVEKG